MAAFPATIIASGAAAVMTAANIGTFIAAGGVAGAIGGFVNGAGMTALGGGNFSQSLEAGLMGAAMGAAIGMAAPALGYGIGKAWQGLRQGIKNYKDGKNFWTGKDVEYGRGRFSLNNKTKAKISIEKGTAEFPSGNQYSSTGQRINKNFSVDNPESFNGANQADVENYLINNGYENAGAINKGVGTRYVQTGSKGNQVLIEAGNPNVPSNNIHSGPYLRISNDGKIYRIPLQGNPILK